MRWLVAVGLLASCGRLDFDARGACPSAATTPDPVNVSGTTFVYGNFAGETDPIPNVPVAAIARDGGAMLATTTSDPSGAYTLAIPSDAAPVDVELDYHYDLVTHVFVDEPLDREIAGTGSGAFQLGDGAMWGDGQMGSVYGTGGAMRAAKLGTYTTGTISVNVHDCDEQLIDGVTVTFVPAPATLVFSGADGFVANATTTQPPFDLAVALNAVPGTTHISASKPGYTFGSVDIPVLDGENATVVVLHGTPNK